MKDTLKKNIADTGKRKDSKQMHPSNTNLNFCITKEYEIVGGHYRNKAVKRWEDDDELRKKVCEGEKQQ